jgi:hypothetical protein
MSDRSPITDSPWFWVYLFSTAALAALVLMTPKFSPRQAEIERQTQGRERAIQQQSGGQPRTSLSERDRTIISLRPLYWIFGGLLLVGWSLLWWRRWRRPTAVPRRATSKVAP